MTNYATPSQYAKLCGVHRSAIHYRIQSGSLRTEQQKDVTGKWIRVINLKKFPPVKYGIGRPKTKDR